MSKEDLERAIDDKLTNMNASLCILVREGEIDASVWVPTILRGSSGWEHLAGVAFAVAKGREAAFLELEADYNTITEHTRGGTTLTVIPGARDSSPYTEGIRNVLKKPEVWSRERFDAFNTLFELVHTRPSLWKPHPPFINRKSPRLRGL